MKSMLKIGVLGFGGGTALIPVIENDTVNAHHLIPEDNFNKYVMLASITPGALPVQLSTGIGYEIAGNRGMAAAAATLAFPGSFLTLLLLAVFSELGETGQRFIGYIAAIVSLLIIYILGKYVFGTVKQARNKSERLLYILIVLGSFVLSGEETLYELSGVSIKPVFGASATQVLLVAFFVILFTKGRLRDLRRLIPALILAICYFACIGDAHLLPYYLKTPLAAAMLLLAAVGLIQSVAEASSRKCFPGRELASSVAVWVVFTLVLSLPALLVTLNTFRILGLGFLSSVMSFGGGDAYLSVAQGLFVDGGIVTGSQFYGRIVTVANALPGSILCKTLTGIGYTYGFRLNGSVMEGIFMGLACFACSVSASGIIYRVVWAVCEKYENLRIFTVVKHFIRPIISGLLINVALTLYLTGIHPYIMALF